MHTWQSGSVRINGLDMHYLRTGKGDQPPLVLAHGFTDNGRCWQRVALDLSANYDLIMPDARGHGLSGLPEVTFSQEDQASDLLEFIDTLSLDKPGVMGHSMGASTASTAAALSPDRIGYLILEDPPWFPPPPPDDGSPRRNWFDWVYAVKTKTYDELVEQCRRDEPNWHEIEIDAWAESKIQFNLGVMTYRTELDPRAWPAVVAKLRCPTLLITAEPGRGIVSPETSAQAAQMSSHIQVVKIDDAGHSIHRDQFEAVMAAVRGFLATV